MKKFLVPVLMIVAVVGCSKPGTEKPDNNDAKEINIQVGVNATRASVESNGSGVLTGGSPITVNFVRTTDDTAADWETTYSTPIAATITAVEGKNVLEFTPTKQYYASNRTHVTAFRGYYPAQAFDGSTGGTSAAEVTFDIDGDTDILLSNIVSGSAEAPITDAKTLTFDHILTKLTVNVIAADQGSADVWGNITGIAVVGTPSNVKVTFAATPGKTTGTPADLAIEGPTTAVPAPLTAATFGTTMVYPAATYTLSITGSTGKTGAAQVTLTDPVLTGGKHHTVTLQFKGQEILIESVKVTPWVEGVEGTPVDVEEVVPAP